MKEAESTCAPCKQFWKREFHQGAESIVRSCYEPCAGTAVLGDRDDLVQKGDRVVVKGKHSGVVKFVGLTEDQKIAPQMHVGVSLYDNVYSTHNGVYRGKRFFYCPRGHGAMVKYSAISPLNPIPKTRYVSGNEMFPSYEAVKKRRKQREQMIFDGEEKLKKQHEIARRAQMEKYTRSAPQPRISARVTKASRLRSGRRDDKAARFLQDNNDITYRDYLIRESRKKDECVDPEHEEQIQLQKLKKVFGGGEKAERMAETFKKLQHAYEKGKSVALAERE